MLKCELRRPFFNKAIQKAVEFFIEYPMPPNNKLPLKSLISTGSINGTKPINFVLTPESIQNLCDVIRII